MINDFTIFGQKIKLSPRKTLFKSHKALGLYLYNENKILYQESTTNYPVDKEVIKQTQCHEILHCWLSKIGKHELSANEEFVENMGSCLYEFLKSQ